MFSTFETYDRNNVKFGNNAPCPMKGKASILLIHKITCDNTYYFEGLNYIFLSVAQLNRLGCKVEFNERKALIYNTVGKSLELNLDKISEIYLMVKFDDVWLWNKRLCHVNFDNLVRINKMKKPRGLPKLKKPKNTM